MKVRKFTKETLNELCDSVVMFGTMVSAVTEDNDLADEIHNGCAVVCAGILALTAQMQDDDFIVVGAERQTKAREESD